MAPSLDQEQLLSEDPRPNCSASLRPQSRSRYVNSKLVVSCGQGRNGTRNSGKPVAPVVKIAKDQTTGLTGKRWNALAAPIKPSHAHAAQQHEQSSEQSETRGSRLWDGRERDGEIPMVSTGYHSAGSCEDRQQLLIALV